MRITIIIPIYNVEPYIEECLQSVVNQTMTEGVECILVDDCGKDRSLEIAKNYVQNYNGNITFKIIEHKANGGLSAARNTGIKAAKGEYLYFLDSDDTITPNCLELMWSYIDKYGKVDLVQGSFYENDEERNRLSPYNLPEYVNNHRKIKYFLLGFEGDIVGAQSRLVRKCIILNNKLFFKEGIIHEDNYWTFTLAKYIQCMAFCVFPTYYHRYNPMSITGKVNIDNEYLAYYTILKDCCEKIDPILPGRQKELLLNTLICALQGGFCRNNKERKELIAIFLGINTFIEKVILFIYINFDVKYIRSKILHFLIRVYKLND